MRNIHGEEMKAGVSRLIGQEYEGGYVTSFYLSIDESEVGSETNWNPSDSIRENWYSPDWDKMNQK